MKKQPYTTNGFGTILITVIGFSNNKKVGDAIAKSMNTLTIDEKALMCQQQRYGFDIWTSGPIT